MAGRAGQRNVMAQCERLLLTPADVEKKTLEKEKKKKNKRGQQKAEQ